MIKKAVKYEDYAKNFMEALPGGLLLTSKADKVNSMIIGWGTMGRNWSIPVVTVFIREHRFTRGQLDANPEFTISIPLGKNDPKITKVCGSQSGRDVDKIQKAGLTLVDGNEVSTPAVLEYPLTLECKIIQSQPMDLSTLESKYLSYYPQDVDSYNTGANKDTHIAYTAKIVDAYIIED